MKKCVIVPDSFKGSMSSKEICAIVKGRVLAHFPDCDAVSVPVADGGEGTVDCFHEILGGELISLPVIGPFGKKVEATYLRKGELAVIEMAQAAGLPLAGDYLNPGTATTFGVGELIRHAVKNGATRLILGLGGSATNDGGVGMAAALGTRFYDGNFLPGGREAAFLPTGDSLSKIVRYDTKETEKLLAGCTVIGICDIDNPLCGESGAAYVFAPQKGADEEMVKLLDGELRSLGNLMEKTAGYDIASVPGSGAAGGMGAGILAFLGGKLSPGIETVLDQVGFESLVEDADLVITGEGKLDTQSLRGKVVIGVSRRAKVQNIPVVALVGDIGDSIEEVYDLGVSGVFSINRIAAEFSVQKERAKSDLSLTADNLMRFIKCLRAPTVR